MKTQQFIHHCEIVNYCVPLWLFNATLAIYIDMNIVSVYYRDVTIKLISTVRRHSMIFFPKCMLLNCKPSLQDSEVRYTWNDLLFFNSAETETQILHLIL